MFLKYCKFIEFEIGGFVLIGFKFAAKSITRIWFIIFKIAKSFAVFDVVFAICCCGTAAVAISFKFLYRLFGVNNNDEEQDEVDDADEVEDDEEPGVESSGGVDEDDDDSTVWLCIGDVWCWNNNLAFVLLLVDLL